MHVMRTIKFAVLFLSLIISSASNAQRAAAPQNHAVDTVVAAERLSRIDGVLQQHVDENRIAGAVALVLRDNRPIYEKAFGWSDKEAGRRMSNDTVFRIASQSKAITSVAILVLLEEGKLTLASPVSRFIPEYAKTTVALKGEVGTVPAKRQITIKDLLTHTSGYSYGTDVTVTSLYEAKELGPAAGYGWYTADKEEPVCTTMARLASLPAVAQPGEAYVYGYSTDILGCVVERASGMPLDQFIATRITTPLGMKDTRFFLPAEQRARLAAVYSSGPDDKIVRAPDGAKGQGHYVDGPRKNFSGGAGLLSTAADYARFLEMIRNGGAYGATRILAPRTVALMTNNQVGTFHSTAGLGFGLGFETTDQYGANGLASVGSFRWGGAYGSTYLVDPAARLTMVFMIQQIPNRTEVATTFQNLVFQALLDSPRIGCS
jgi:CubicO group peptidase (beta-lactamase class C family)